MIKKHKKQLILSSIVILLPIVIGLLLWEELPAQIITHWGGDGTADGWSSKTFTIFVMPLILLAFHWICIFFTLLDPKTKEQSSKVFNMVLWIMPVLSLLDCGFTYAIALGQDINIDILVRLLLAFIFLVMGNYMPKCKQNHTIGIKVTWALKNEENWNKTHRFAGKLWVIGGLLLLLTLWIPLKNYAYFFLPLILLMAFVPMIYSYLYYRKQLTAGTATREDGKMTSAEKKGTRIAIIIVIFVLCFVLLMFLKGDYQVIYSDSSFTVDATLWNDATIHYADIENIEYCERKEPGLRTFGYGTPSIVMGQCENKAFGAYTSYCKKSCDTWVILTVKRKIFALNGENEAETKAIYEELLLRTGK